MDLDPTLRQTEAEFGFDNLKQHMYQSVLELLMSDESNTHVVGYEKLESSSDPEAPAAYVRHRVDRNIDTKNSDVYQNLSIAGIDTVSLNYVPDQNNRLDSLHGEFVTMAVGFNDGSSQMLKMRIRNSGHLEEIESVTVNEPKPGVYDSGDTKVDDLEFMSEIADEIRRAEG